MKILLIILSIIGLLKLISLLLHISILLIKNNILKENKDGGVSKHYHEIKRSLSCGICDWIYLIPTIRTTISSGYFEIEIDIFFVYLFVSYKIVDIDNDEK